MYEIKFICYALYPGNKAVTDSLKCSHTYKQAVIYIKMKFF